MASKFQQKKYKQFFKATDTNSDGILDESDFMAQIDRLAEIRGIDINSEVVQNERKEMHTWWLQFSTIVDTDGDGKLTEAEVTTFWSTLADNAAEEAQDGKTDIRNMISASAESTFNVLDENNDGSINIEEYSHWLESWDNNTDAKAAFTSMAGRTDGSLTKQQVIDCVLNFFLSDDAKAIGNHIYGVLPS